MRRPSLPRSSPIGLLLLPALLCTSPAGAEPQSDQPVPLPILTREQRDAARAKSQGSSGMIEYDLVSRLERPLPFPDAGPLPPREAGDGEVSPADPPPLARDFSGHYWIFDPTTGIYPRHVRLRMRFLRLDGMVTGGTCSGTLVSPFHVVTAAHCVYRFEEDDDGTAVHPWAIEVIAQPGFADGVGPTGTANGTTLRTFTSWTQNEDYDGDVALVTLDRPIGALVGWRGLGSTGSWSFFDQDTWEMFAYPGSNFDETEDLGARRMYRQTGNYDYDDYPSVGVDRPSYRGTSGGGAIKNGNVWAVRSHMIQYVDGDVDTYDTAIQSGQLQAFISGMLSDRPHGSDLAPLDVRVSDDEGGVGTIIDEVSFLIHNRGGLGHTSGVHYAIMIGPGPITRPDHTVIHDGYYSPVIGSEGSQRLVFPNLVVPTTLAAGDYVIGVILDPDDFEPGNDSTGDQDVTAFTVLCQNVGSPQLAFPENGHPCVGTDITLDWGSVPGIGIRYDVTWGRSPLANEDARNLAGTQTTIFGLDPGTQYWWRVRAISPCGAASAFSDPFTFHTAGNLEVTSRLDPAPDATCLGTNVVLAWNPVPGAALYRVRLRNLATGVESFLDSNGTTMALGDLAPNTEYKWSMRARNACAIWGPETSRWSFSTASTAAIDAVAVAPVNGAFTGSDPEFSVVDDAAAAEVHYELATVTGAPVASWVNGAVSQRHGLTGGEYRWRARILTCTLTGNGFGAWTDWEDFEVDETAPILLYPPDPISPSLNTWTSHPLISVSWMPAEDNCCVAGYSVVLDGHPFTVPDPEVDVEPAGSWEAEGSLGENWFHIVAVDAFGNVSAPHHLGPFLIDDVAPPAPVAVASVNPNTWTSTTAIDVAWQAVADSGSGTAGYSLAWTIDPDFVLDDTLDTTERTSRLDPATEGTWRFLVRAIDEVGNSGPTTELRFFVDHSAPVNHQFQIANGVEIPSGDTVEVLFVWHDNAGQSQVRVEHFYSTNGGTSWYEAICAGGCSTPSHLDHDVNTSSGRGPYYWVAPWVTPGSEVLYRMVARDTAGNTAEYVSEPFVILVTTDTGEVPAIERVTLRGNVPNPFNPRTTIAYEIPFDTHVELVIYDVSGRLVRRLVNEFRVGPARHEVTWDGRDAMAREVSSGVYLCRLRAGEEFRTQRMVLVR